MSDQIFEIKSISQAHEIFGLPKPKHPLVSLLDVKQIDKSKFPIGTRISNGFYTIWLKDTSCGVQYGRNHFDFDSGVMVFTAPGQVMSVIEEPDSANDRGWILSFHPDLIRKSPLGEKIDSFTFFSYESFEALHLSEEEEEEITDCAFKIKKEYDQRIDNHSQQVITTALDLLLSYCSRYYERQFNTRTNQHQDFVGVVEKELKKYLSTNQAVEYGPPSIHYLADKVNLSSGYLSDMLKKETGKSGKDYINYHLVEQAKNILLSTDQTVNEVAYNLGFNYPHYFSRLFKAKTGMSPLEYRSQN